MNLKPSERRILMKKALQNFIEAGKSLEYEIEWYNKEYKETNTLSELKTLTKIVGENYNDYKSAYRELIKYDSISPESNIYRDIYKSMCTRMRELVIRWGKLKIIENELTDDKENVNNFGKTINRTNISKNINSITDKTIKRFNNN